MLEAEAGSRRPAKPPSLLDHLQDAVFLTDLNGRITYFGEAAERLYGWSSMEAVGRRAAELLAVDEEAGLEDVLAEVRLAGEWSGPTRHATKAEGPRQIDSRWILLRDRDGRPSGALVINTDIERRRELEAYFLLAQRLENLSVLARGIGHDLNNVLAPILLSTNLLERRIEDAAGRQILASVETSAKRALELGRELLSFAKSFEGKEQALHVKHFVTGLQKVIENTFPDSISLETEYSDDLWHVRGKATELFQLLLDLCLSSRDAMPRGGVLGIAAENLEADAALVARHPGASPGRYVRITVSDTGAGIPPQALAETGEPLAAASRGGRSERARSSLAVVALIARDHGGFVEISSRPDEETVVAVYLPAAEEPEPGPRSAPEDLGEPLPEGRGETVLVVEDEASVREMIQKMLESYGYRVIGAKDGTEALALFVQHREGIDLVLTDLAMPYLDGHATIRALLRIRPDLPIIATSGLNQETRPEEVARLGARSFLAKPFTPGQLLAVLRDALGDRFYRR